MSIFIHKTANVSSEADIHEEVKIWVNVQVREHSVVGTKTILSKDVYVDCEVKIGKRCKIQNGVSIYNGVKIGDDVFIGPNAAFTNDKVPRAFIEDWKISETIIEDGASIGANSTIVCGVRIGKYAMVAAGSVVTKDVPPFTLVMGNPAKSYAEIDRSGRKMKLYP
jgi:UDP-2-acetamido-3-amino-2,3-dideoxy-glucuronate N-acetyltransferase